MLDNNLLSKKFVLAAVDSLPAELTKEQKEFIVSRRGCYGFFAKRLREALGCEPKPLDYTPSDDYFLSSSPNNLELDFLATFLEALPPVEDLGYEKVEFFIAERGRKGVFNKRLCEALGCNVNLDPRLQEQVLFYREVFGLEVNAMSVDIPPEPPERNGCYNWLLFIPKGMTLKISLAKCRERFMGGCEWSPALDDFILNNEALTSYTVRLRDCVESDEDWMSLKMPLVKTLECILLELWYHWSTGGHLAPERWTMCSESYNGQINWFMMDNGRFFLKAGSASLKCKNRYSREVIRG